MISQLLLPICLSLMMLSIGLSLSLADFKRVFDFPKSVAVGLALQLLALPAVAWVIILSTQLFTELHYSIAAGLIIIAACPSGATSNIISHLSGANSALSVTLTAVNSLIAPFVLPLSLTVQLSFLSLTDSTIELPILKTWLQLTLVTLIPLTLGMYLKHRFKKQIESYQKPVSKLSGIIFITLVIYLIFDNWQPLSEQANLVIYLCLSLCLSALFISQLICKKLSFDSQTSRTLAIEVCIQNAGTGMFIALSVFKQPEFTLLPLSYGILMNIPALLFILHGQWQQQAILSKRHI